jgi:lysozyme
MLYGGGKFRDMARHPESVVNSGYSSAAAGAYQFLPATWNEAARRLSLPDFQPASQDQAALYLMEKRGALSRFDRQGLSHDVLDLLAQEWASLPTLHGGSYYGQPVKGVQELRRFYSEDLARQRGRTV